VSGAGRARGPGRPGPGRPVALLSHSYYEEDPRVRRQAEALAAAGWSVDVFALRRPGEPAAGVLEGVRVERLDVRRHQGAGVPTYLAEYSAFFVRAAAALARAQRRRHYRLVQVATLPDWLVFAALPERLVGVPLLLDLHEAMPEFFRSRFPGAANPLAYRLLRLQERLSLAAATHLLTVNEALRERLLGLGVAPDGVTVIRNSPALARFDPAALPGRDFMADGTLRLVYAGAVTPMYELDVVLEGLARLRTLRPGLPLALEVYGRGDSRAALTAAVARLGLEDAVTFHGRIPLEVVPAAIAAADVGLAPTRRDPFTEMSLSTKLFEYAAMGKPIVCSDLPLVASMLGRDALWAYPAGDAAGFAAALAALMDKPLEREARAARALVRTRELAWEHEAVRYVALLERFARP
jgi:glycosyltransferase involved in cell wall biosynthesis